MNPIPLGSFDLKCVLGRGGMGEVWRGVHRDQGVPVAVKVLTDQSARDRNFRSSFRNEVRAVAGLDHPNITLVFDYGEIGEATEAHSDGRLVRGTPYLVMELAEGGSMNRQRGRLRWGQLRGILLCLLDALSHAHARGVIHRDLKPANVLIGNGVTEVKLTDFGLAHALRRELEARAEEDFRAGTPAYMAPEQFEGRWRDYGPWTDLYALGCLTWALACGNPPFEGEDRHASMRAHLWESPPRLRARCAVPDGFERWVRRLLDKDPGRRFRRAADAAWALAQLEDGDLVDTGELTAIEIDDEVTQSLEASRTTLAWVSAAEADTGDTTTIRRAPRGSGQSTAPPLPADWRRANPVAPSRKLLAAGLGLFGLRSFSVVDRDGERTLLWEQLRRVGDEGTARGVLVHGPAGTGKTRLAEWLAERAHEVGAASVLKAGHGPVAGPGTGITRMIADYLRCEGLERTGVLARTQSTLFWEGITDDDEAHALTELIVPATRSDIATGARAIRFASPTERFVLVRRLVARAAHERPVVMVLDDVQWGRETLDFVCHLLDEQDSDPIPVLVVLVAREDALALRPAESTLIDRIAANPRVAAIEVANLTGDDRAHLVREILRLEGELAAQVERRTGGNPQFAVQLVGSWIERGLLVAGERGFRLAQPTTIELPADLRAVWETRVARVVEGRPAEQVVALELAAVLGQDVEAMEYREACARGGWPVPYPLLDALLAQRQIRCPAGGLAVGWSFVHGAFRESLEQHAAMHGRDQMLHRVCAGMLASRTGRGVPERLGIHLVAAGELEDALEPLAEGVHSRLTEGDHRVAANLLGARERALELLGLPAGDPRWGIGWILWSELERGRGRAADADQWAERAEGAAREHGWSSILADALRQRGCIAQHLGEASKAWRLLQLAEQMAEEAGDRHQTALARRDLGSVLVSRGSLDRAEGYFHRAWTDFEALGDDRWAGSACLGMVEAARQAGRLVEGRAWLERARDRFQRAGSRSGVAMCANDLGDVARLQGDLETAQAEYADALQRMEALGLPQTEIARANLGLVLIEQARFREARPLLERAATVLKRQQRRALTGAVHACLLPCAAAEGDWTAFARHFDAAVALVDETGIVDVDIARAAHLAGDLAHSVGEVDRARECWTVALGQWTALDRPERDDVAAALAAVGGPVSRLFRPR